MVYAFFILRLKQTLTPRGSENCGLPEYNLLVLALSVSLTDLADELEKQAVEVRHCKENLLPAVMRESTIPAEPKTFQIKFEEFLEKDEAETWCYSVVENANI